VSETALNRMIASSEALIAALDAHDIDAIESALLAFGESVGHLKSSGNWQSSPELSARIRQALALADSARTRVRFLADSNRQRIDMLAVAAGRFDCTPVTYSRSL
jgi:hypothetical protein